MQMDLTRAGSHREREETIHPILEIVPINDRWLENVLIIQVHLRIIHRQFAATTDLKLKKPMAHADPMVTIPVQNMDPPKRSLLQQEFPERREKVIPYTTLVLHEVIVPVVHQKFHGQVPVRGVHLLTAHVLPGTDQAVLQELPDPVQVPEVHLLLVRSPPGPVAQVDHQNPLAAGQENRVDGDEFAEKRKGGQDEKS